MLDASTDRCDLTTIMDLSSAAQEDIDSREFQSASPGGSDNDLDQEEDSAMTATETSGKNGMTNGKSAASNAKDPNRPRRKKARRACFACQRAHLTCGDERPCQRCIKRGLADQCQDGVRKKAKYLHDAPNEALLPGAANHFDHGHLRRSSTVGSTQNENQSPQQPYFGNTSPFPQMFNTTPSSLTVMPPPQMHERTASFGQQSSYGSNMSQPMQSPTSVRQHAQSVSMPTGAWQDTLFDSDPAVFNFDLASMNFGNHYGALEFGMLGKMATGAGDTSDNESQRGSMYQMPFGSISESPTVGYGEGMMDWTNGINMYQMHHGQKGPNAFAIESNMHNWTSPETHSITPEGMKHEGSPVMNMNINLPQQQQPQMNLTTPSPSQFLALTPAQVADMKPPTTTPTQISTPQLKAKTQLPAKPVTAKRTRDPSSIYTAVITPYPYTTGFHNLIAYLQKRFSQSPSKTLAIAKSLASIRPSFIATTKTLNRDDLVFMEKCFQRTLWEYEGFIESVGTPTIVARRTGEIAAVGKEFQILTGWKKNVLLGREPNLNVNTGHSGTTPEEAGSGSNTKGRGTGTNTPARRRVEEEQNNMEGGGNNRQQPVFLAELLDDDSVVKFYDDFSKLAFGDSRGSVMGRCRLLKYRTKDDEMAANLLKADYESQVHPQLDKETNQPQPRTENHHHHHHHPHHRHRSSDVQRTRTSHPQTLQRMDTFAMTRPADAKKGISGEKGMQKLGNMDGRVDATFCWTIKRDVFDIPMCIILNFLPCI